MSDTGRDPRRSWQHDGRIAAIGIGLAAVYAAFRSSIDLDPLSLWHDDVWVVALAVADDWSAMLASPASASPAFKAIVRVAASIGSDLELSVQAFPFASGVMAVVGTGWLAWRLTASVPAAVAAALFLACDVVFLRQMARVKTYSFDALLLAGQALLLLSLLAAPTRRHLWAFASLAVVGLLISTVSLFSTGAFVIAAGLGLQRAGRIDRAALTAAAVIAITAVLTVAAGLGAAGQTDLRALWEGHFLPADEPRRALAAMGRWSWRFVARLMHGAGLHVGPLPGATGLGLALAVAGASYLWHVGRRASLGSGALVFVLFFAASAAGRFPIGAQRLEVFLVPLGAVLLGAALGWLSKLRSWPGGIAAAGAAGLLLAQLWTERTPGYPQEHSTPVIARLAREIRPGDALWVNLRGTYSLAVYGPWAVAYEETGRLGIPHPLPLRPHTEVMDIEVDEVDQPPPDRERVFLFICNAGPDLWEQSLSLLETRGYHSVLRFQQPRCRLEKLRRTGATGGYGKT